MCVGHVAVQFDFSGGGTAMDGTKVAFANDSIENNVDLLETVDHVRAYLLSACLSACLLVCLPACLCKPPVACP